MLKTLNIKNFTVFREADFQFGPGLNVVLGVNGAGKSHLLKLAYTAAAASYQSKQESKTAQRDFETLLKERLMDIFRADSLENLVYAREELREAQVSVMFDKKDCDIEFYIQYPSEKRTTSAGFGVTRLPTGFVETSPVFIPTREILSIIPAFAKFHREKELLLDGTYFDLSFMAQIADPKFKMHQEIAKIVKQLGTLLEGKVVQGTSEIGRFYLERQSGFRLEMPLVAEGLRKIAMLSCLLENGAIQPKTLLFWDEPEANLNPLLMTELARLLVKMSDLNMQIVIATHSLFFLREVHIALSETKKKGRYIALDKRDGVIQVSQADSVDDIEPIAALDADLKQTDRYMALEE